MNVSQASKIWLDYHRAHSKENTVRAYEFTIAKFNQNFEMISKRDFQDLLELLYLSEKGRSPNYQKIVVVMLMFIL